MISSRRTLLLTAATAALVFVPAAQAGLTMLQIESYFPQGQTHYAPVDLSTSTTYTNASGTTFERLGNATGQSTHARDVWANAYSNSGGTLTYQYSRSANDYLNFELTASPSYLGGGNTSRNIHVATNAWVGSTGSATTDSILLRRMDYQLNREKQTVMVNGAATLDSTNGNSLMGGAFNGLAVRGTQTLAFSPTWATGKQHADLWVADAASYGAGTVAGTAARLISTAQGASQTNAAANSVVIRSILMTGADKSQSLSTESNGIKTWTRDTANNLSRQLGAGKVDAVRSLSILNAGERSAAPVTGSTITGSSTTATRGWTFGNVTTGSQAVVFQAQTNLTGVTATLNWNFTQKSTAGANAWSDNNAAWDDLSLKLVSVTPNGNGGFTLGTDYSSTLGLGSNATNDNVEHLSWTGDLAAGYYAFIVTGSKQAGTDYGLSYNVVTAVPEPGILSTVVVGTAALSLRRKRASR